MSVPIAPATPTSVAPGRTMGRLDSSFYFGFATDNRFATAVNDGPFTTERGVDGRVCRTAL